MAAPHDSLDIESTDQLGALLAAGGPLAGQRWQNLDLTTLSHELTARDDLTGVAVLGGRYSPELGEHLRRAGAWVFPAPPGLPVDPYRARLYTPDELYDQVEAGYEHCVDARGYAWARDTRSARDPLVTALQAIHDDSMTDALVEHLHGHPVVGVMGGHAVERTDQAYRDAALLAHALRAEGLTVITGGGPGAMEAANLGACCTSAAQVGTVLAEVAGQPGWRAGVGPWARAALATRHRHGLDGTQSVSVPTWFYGHEPPNVFASQVAKYFSNALREDILLACCTAGVVVLPGAAGTVQEVFQLATRLYYAPAGDPLPPLVLVGREHWTRSLPVAQLAEALGRGRPMAAALSVVDTPAEAAEVIVRHHQPRWFTENTGEQLGPSVR